MRALRSSVSEQFHVVLSFDNSLPHLLTDADLLAAFRELLSVLRPGGILLCSVRDYERIDRSATSTHPYGTRWRGRVEYPAPSGLGVARRCALRRDDGHRGEAGG
jgi:predicted SAM-dependent methyltransferase